MKKQLVTIHDNEGRAGTKIIADGFNRKHDQIKRLVKKYQKEFEKISPLRGDITKGKTKNFKEYFLNEDQFMFLGSLLRNNSQVVEFKLRLILEFKRVRGLLKRALTQKNENPEYAQARLNSIAYRKLETDEIQKFIEYAKKQGGSEKGCNMYYANITKMMNGLLFICEGKFKVLRNVLTPMQLFTVGSAEQIIKKSLKEDMGRNLFYKEIYKNAKAKIKLFAELHGQSKVVEESLRLEAKETQQRVEA